MTGPATRRAALGAILAAPLAAAPATAAPSDLARACDAAVARIAYLNRNDEPDAAWPDERTTAENLAFDDVLNRIAVEPARDLADLGAKARLCLCEWSENIGIGNDLNAGERALLALLREVSVLNV